jgi:hypothetical protein
MIKTKFIIFLTLLFLPLATSAMLINEIAWMGTDVQWQNEWLELYNPTDKKINLSGWILKTKDESLFIELKGSVQANSYFLLERTDDSTIENIEADQIYKGSLKNSGQHLLLLNPIGEIADEINCSLGWTAGDNETKKTMEKNGDSWQTSFIQGGTPKAINSQPKEVNKKSLSSTTRSGLNYHFPALLGLGFLSSFFSTVLAKIFYLQLAQKQIKIKRL